MPTSRQQKRTRRILRGAQVAMFAFSIPTMVGIIRGVIAGRSELDPGLGWAPAVVTAIALAGVRLIPLDKWARASIALLLLGMGLNYSLAAMDLPVSLWRIGGVMAFSALSAALIVGRNPWLDRTTYE